MQFFIIFRLFVFFLFFFFILGLGDSLGFLVKHHLLVAKYFLLAVVHLISTAVINLPLLFRGALPVLILIQIGRAHV